MTSKNRARRSPAVQLNANTLQRRLTNAARGLLLIVAAALAPMAQSQVLMSLGNASVFEGASGTRLLKLPVTLGGVNTTTVTGVASAIPLSGAGFNPATAGSSCGAGVDFVSFSNAPFSIPPNTPNGTRNVDIVICGDAAVETDEHIFVSLTNVAGGAFCTPESCGAIGTIVNDDGTPSISIGDISVSEPVIGTKVASFPVKLHHETTLPVSVHFVTRDGTAKARTATNFGDYVGTSGTLSIPANTLSGTIPVTILSDRVTEQNQTLFVDLSSPTNTTILDGSGQGTIRDTTLSIGGFDLSPDAVAVESGDTIGFDFVWTVPEGQVWRDLESLDFRIGKGKPVLWVRWDEATNNFSLCETSGEGANEEASTRRGPPQRCGPGAAPGSATVLSTPSAQLRLAETTVVGSGALGPSVTLHLVVSFGPDIKDHTYPVEVAAADDFGQVDRFVRAGEVRVE